MRLVGRTRIRRRRGRGVLRSLPLGAARSCLNIVPSLLRLVELSNPALRQRRAIGRRLIGGLGRGSTVLLLRSRRAVLLRWRDAVLLRGRRTVLLGGSRRTVLLGRSAVSAVTVATGV
jgi:hypothetical protein